MAEIVVDQDFGPVNYILSQWLKLSLVLHESRQFVGRSYIFRKTKNRQLKDGTQTGTYWRCMKCEEIIKAKGGRVTIDGEGSGRLVIISDRLITDPESNHHSECCGVDGKIAESKQIVRRKRLLSNEKYRYPERKRPGVKIIPNRNCDPIQSTDDYILNGIRLIKEDAKMDEASSKLDDQIYSNRCVKSELSTNDSDDLNVLPSISSAPTLTKSSNNWMLYYNPNEKILSVCNETDEIFKILQNRSKDSSKSILSHYFQSSNFDARSLMPEIHKFVLNLLSENFTF